MVGLTLFCIGVFASQPIPPESSGNQKEQILDANQTQLFLRARISQTETIQKAGEDLRNGSEGGVWVRQSCWVNIQGPVH